MHLYPCVGFSMVLADDGKLFPVSVGVNIKKCHSECQISRGRIRCGSLTHLKSVVERRLQRFFSSSVSGCIRVVDGLNSWERNRASHSATAAAGRRDLPKNLVEAPP